MRTKLGKSVTLWMLKSTNTNSFLAIDSRSFVYPAHWLCPYYDICRYEMVVSTNKIGVESVARQWNKTYRQDKVKPVKVRVTLEFLSKGANDEN